VQRLCGILGKKNITTSNSFSLPRKDRFGVPLFGEPAGHRSPSSRTSKRNPQGSGRESRFWQTRGSGNHNFATTEKVRIDRKCPRAEKSDCCRHSNHGKVPQLAVKQVSTGRRNPGNRIPDPSYANQTARQGSDKPNQKEEAAENQQRARQNDIERPLAARGQIQRALYRRCDTNCRSQQQECYSGPAAWKRGK
jgi:hypothetical protein